MNDLVPPAYGRASLADLLPAALIAMGSEIGGPAATLGLPVTGRICLLLVDGLGFEALAASDPADAPILHELLAGAASLDAGFPSSTPISLCSLGTGRPPGEHGIVGFTMHVPPVPAVLECLAWIGYGSGSDLTAVLPPERLQPIEPLFGQARRDGIAATVVSAAEHLGSGLSRAAFRGAAWDPIPAFEDLGSRTRHVSDALQRADRALVYTYDPRLDYAVHRWGMGSPAWRTALQTTDELVRALLEALPTGATLLVTGDHGGLNVPEAERVDLAERRDLADGVAWLSGDPRARHVHAEPERAREVLDAWRSGLTDGWAVLARDEAVDGGLFGPDVRAEVRDRIGDVVAIATGAGGLFDRRRFPWETRLIGFHGALTPAELRVPLLVASR